MFGAGTYDFAAPTLLAQDAIRLRSDTTLIGRGASQTRLQVTGLGPINHFFDASGASRVTIRDMTIAGNGVAADRAPDAGGLLRAVLEAGATADMADILLINCTLDNFGSAAWCRFVNRSAEHVIRRVGSRGCTWKSRVLPPRAESIGVLAHFLYFFGEIGLIGDIVVDDQGADAALMKGAVAIRGNIDGASVTLVQLESAGRELAHIPTGPDGNGSYGILGYATASGAPRNLKIRIAKLTEPFSVGVYLAGVTDTAVEIGEAFGQRDTRDDTLPKGLLALNQCRRVTATIGRAADSSRVLMVALPQLTEGEAGAGIAVRLDRVESRVGAIDVTVRAPIGGRAGGLRISGARSGPAAVGVSMMIDRRTRLSGIDLSGFAGTGARQAVVAALPDVEVGAVRLPVR